MKKKKIEKIIVEKGEEICQKTHSLGIAKGHKISNGKDTGKDAIIIFVKQKLPENALLEKEKIPKKIDGQITDVIEIGGEILPMTHRKKHRPIIGGISGKVEGGTACSIGIVCFKDRKPWALTNEHCVMHPPGQNNVGKQFLQPSPLDRGKLSDTIGTIINQPKIKRNIINKIDSHIIPLNDNVMYDLTVLGLGNYEKKWVEPKIGMPFVKIGRTTGKTTGKITHINALARVNFRGKLGVCKFYPCIFALQNNYNIVAGGDSGSCIFNEQGVIGQTFAAAPNLAIFLTGSVVGEELGIKLSRPIEGFVALGNWLNFNKLNIITRARTNFRKEAGLNGKIIKALPVRTKLEIISDKAIIKDNYIWLKVEEVK